MYVLGHHFEEHSLLKLVFITLVAVVVVFGVLFFFAGCAHAMGGHLIEAKAQLAEEMNTKLTAQENHIKDLQSRIDGQAVAMAGINNTVSKVSTDIKAGRDANSGNVNDPKLMADYIQAMKDSHTEIVGTMWKIIDGLLIQIGTLIGLLGWCLKSLLKARDRDSDIDDKIIAGAFVKKEAENVAKSA